MDSLRKTLRRIDGRGYRAYRDLQGTFSFADYRLTVLHVQGDPFAAPSRVEVRIPFDWLDVASIDPLHPDRRVGVEDALLRALAGALDQTGGRRGSGRSGQWSLVGLGQEMVPRTACELSAEALTVRLSCGLPASGRTVLGRQAEAMFFEELPWLVTEGLLDSDLETLRRHADAHQDQEVLRRTVAERGWVAFVADASCLPRRSGVDDRPLERGAVPFVAPAELAQTVALPNAGPIRGAAFDRGVTLICGGGYHGKSTLLRTVERGIYNHVPGDGRELCATVEGAVHVRAEDGRAVRGVDISAFIAALPDGRDTTAFTTDNASGSTSQAASIVEAVELGATALLIDEDTSATNFMVRDRRMQELVQTADEPITPFIDRARELHDRLGVSSILAVGGSGDTFDVADRVIVMRRYVAEVATERVRAICDAFPSNRLTEHRPPLQPPSPRRPRPDSLDARAGHRGERVRTHRTDVITFGEHEIDISALAQCVDAGQARTLGDWLLWCSRQLVDGERPMAELCALIALKLRAQPLSSTCAAGFGDRVGCRPIELGFALNRLRSLEVDQR